MEGGEREEFDVHINWIVDLSATPLYLLIQRASWPVPVAPLMPRHRISLKNDKTIWYENVVYVYKYGTCNRNYLSGCQIK